MKTDRISNDAVNTGPAEIAENLGRLKIPYLHHYWQRFCLKLKEPAAKSLQEHAEWDLENTLLSGLGLNVLETVRFLHSASHTSFDSLEEWILETNGVHIEEARLTRLRDALAGKPVVSPAGSLVNVEGLTTEKLAFWDEHGYVIVHDAVASNDCQAAAAAIHNFLDVDPDDPQSWYGNKYGKTIWVPLLRHSAFLANRQAPRLVKAFAQLWGRADLWATVDQGGFNPPERNDWKFPGPHVHWDASLATPHCFGVQGILYLTDTPADWGAFSCIPGFHRRFCLESRSRAREAGFAVETLQSGRCAMGSFQPLQIAKRRSATQTIPPIVAATAAEPGKTVSPITTTAAPARAATA
jgi:hypothetical protein